MRASTTVGGWPTLGQAALFPPAGEPLLTDIMHARAAARPIAWADAARKGPTVEQYGLAACAIGATAVVLKLAPTATVGGLHLLFLLVFAWAGAQRAALTAVSALRPPPVARALPDAALPSYTIIAPLLREVAMVAGLFDAFERIDYPRHRLQVVFALEPDEAETLAAVRARAARSPLAVDVSLSPRSGPRTKPKACNAALRLATGELVVVYDAEDQPHPGQLREAAARFAADAGGRLACLQAPLRVLPGRGWLQRQFAMEYAALFDVTIPALAALGLPFPLGGTSNHFRRDTLQELGGWDAWNVTEDADVGFRLAAAGRRLGALRLPTWEPAPASLEIWSPQRSRWIKGHMQTWGVHMRRPGAGGWRRAVALQATLGLSLVSSVMHGAMAAGVVACLTVAAAGLRAPDIAAADWWLLAGGWASAALAIAVGEARCGRRLALADALGACAYWPLQSLAAMFAIWELVARPFHWSKTPHEPVAAVTP